MKCNNCGNELKNGTTFCEYCGTKVEGAAPQPPVNNQVYGGYPQPPKSSGTGLKVVIIIMSIIILAGIGLGIWLLVKDNGKDSGNNSSNNTANTNNVVEGNNTVDPPVDNTTKQMVCTINGKISGGITLNATYTLTYQGNYLLKSRFQETYIPENENDLDSIKESVYNTYNTSDEKYGGYTIMVSKLGAEKKVEADVRVNYEEMNLTQYAKDYPETAQFIENGHMIFTKVKEVYKAQGFTCK